MNILHVNIRASQGGAGQVALDLHRRLILQGVNSRFLYGYASGIKDDGHVINEPDIRRLGTKTSVLANYLAHRLAGLDPFTGNKELLHEWIEWADLVHMHAPHHYYLNWNYFLRELTQARKPLVITAHDWWFITGRCGFTEDCTGWKRTCGECGLRRQRDLPSLLDLSRRHRVVKLEGIARLGKAVHFVCPSNHLADDYRKVLSSSIDVIPNSVDLTFERYISSINCAETKREGFLFSASDLSSPGKIDADLVRELSNRRDVRITLAGRNNPFRNDGAVYLGEIKSRTAMADVFRDSLALIFCSRMDNAPLTIIEALVSGCFVAAYESPAAQESLARVGGRCVRDREEMLQVITQNRVSELYGNIDRAELIRRARQVYFGAVADSYVQAYRKMLVSTWQ